MGKVVALTLASNLWRCLLDRPAPHCPSSLGALAIKIRMHVSAFRFLWHLICTDCCLVERQKSQKLFTFAQVIEVTKEAKVRFGGGRG
jgi:hypothetical protein